IKGELTGEDGSYSAENGEQGNEFFDGLQSNYRDAFVDMIATFQNINSTLTSLATKIDIMDQKIAASTNRMEQMESKLTDFVGPTGTPLGNYYSQYN
ncbi:unnamed protein product, partial [Allacma fusca]